MNLIFLYIYIYIYIYIVIYMSLQLRIVTDIMCFNIELVFPINKPYESPT